MMSITCHEVKPFVTGIKGTYILKRRKKKIDVLLCSCSADGYLPISTCSSSARHKGFALDILVYSAFLSFLDGDST